MPLTKPLGFGDPQPTIRSPKFLMNLSPSSSVFSDGTNNGAAHRRNERRKGHENNLDYIRAAIGGV
jgi:hypothetical protein